MPCWGLSILQNIIITWWDWDTISAVSETSEYGGKTGPEMLMIPVSGSVTTVTTRIMPWMPQITSQPPPLLLPDLATIPAVEDRAQFISKPLNDLFSIYINLYFKKSCFSSDSIFHMQMNTTLTITQYLHPIIGSTSVSGGAPHTCHNPGSCKKS